MQKEKLIRTVLVVLAVIAFVVLTSHLDYIQLQEDMQAQKDCVTEIEY